VVRVAGEELLVDVARVGMTMLYFRTKDGRFGRAIKGAQGWSYRLFERPEQREQVALLFDALKKRIRVGFFELPNALPPAEVQ